MDNAYVLLALSRSTILVKVLRIVLLGRFGKMDLVLLFLVLLDIFGIQVLVFSMSRLVPSILTGMDLLVLHQAFSVQMDLSGTEHTVLLNPHAQWVLTLVVENVCIFLSCVFQITPGMAVNA